MAAQASSELAQLFDSYGRQARVFPGLLTIFPPLLAILSWFPWLLLSNVMATFLTIAMSCGLLYALASYARTKGKRAEPKLLKSWGGWPTTILLRHDSELDPHTRKRYHTYLSTSVPLGLTFPTLEEERADRAAADHVYDSAVRWLKESARGREHVMVLRENAQYGFRRNLWGLKTVGLVLCFLTLALIATAVLDKFPGLWMHIKSKNYEAIRSAARELGPAILSATFVNVLAVIAWIFVVTKKWVREAGMQYASAILAICDKPAQ